MKRILAITLAIILVLSCCPNVFASAEGASTDSSTTSGLDPHIKEIIESELPQEERDTLVSLDPSLANKTIIRVCIGNIYSYSLTTTDFFREIGTYVHNPLDATKFYYVLTDKPYCICLYQGKLSSTSAASQLPTNIPFIRDIVNLPAQVEVNGKLSTVTGIYCFQGVEAFNQRTNIACILTESGALFKYYIYSSPCKATYSESDILKYGKDYVTYYTTDAKNDKGRPVVGSRPVSFYEFVNNYDKYMKQTNERLSKIEAYQRMVKITRIYSAYWPIALGVVLVTGAAAVGVVLYRKRRKAAIPVEQVADPVDDP